MNTCPLTLALEVKENASGPLDDGYLHVLVVTRGAISVSAGPEIQVVPAGSLWAASGPWAVEARASAMDYWLIEPLMGPQRARFLSPEFQVSAVRSIEGARQEVEGKASPFWRCFARGHLFDLLQGLRRSLEAGTEASLASASASPWVVNRLLFLHAELVRQPTLAEAAQQAGMNRDAFSRRVRAETGQTFHELLTDLRLRKAEWLVRQTRLPLARVAEEVGLRDQTHFTRLFKAHYAVTPSRYRWGQTGRKAEGF